MVVPNLVFDIILFGALVLGTVLDALFPVLHGAATLIAVGAASYVAAQELGETMQRRGWWTQESLATALSLSTIGFIYFQCRNDSDLSLLVLSIGLMMASLMVAIALIAAAGTALREKRPSALVGLALTAIGSFGLGLLASLLILGPAPDAAKAVPTAIDWPKVIIMVVAFVLWKVREGLRPPVAEAAGNPALAAPTDPAPTVALQPTNRWLIPRQGTLLDRFVPVLVLGALLFLFLQQSGRSMLSPLTPPASAYSHTENSSR